MAAACVGDGDQDGSIAFEADVQVLIDILSGERPCVPQFDADEDGFCTMEDIDGLVEALETGACAPDPCAADVNADGSVSGSDFLAVQRELGCTTNCTADINGDGVVNGDDFAAFTAAWGESGCFVAERGNGVAWGQSAYNSGAYVAVAKNGDAIAASFYTGVVDLDPGARTFPRGDDGYSSALSRIGPDGALRWARTFVTSDDGFGAIGNVAVDDEGNIYAAGSLYGISTDAQPTLAFEDTPDDALVHGHGAVVLSLDADGRLRWARIVETYYGGAVDLAVADDAVYLSGQFTLSADLDPTEGTDVHEYDANFRGLVALDREGAFRWARSFATTLGGSGSVTATADGFVLVGVGEPDAGVPASSFDVDAAVHRFDHDGSQVDVLRWQGPGYTSISSVDRLADGGLVYVGYGEAGTPIEPSGGGDLLVEAGTFIGVLEADGGTRWAHALPGAGLLAERGSDDTIVLVGGIHGATPIDPSDASVVIEEGPAALAYSAAGALQWASELPSSVRPVSVAVASDGFVRVGGSLDAGGDMEPGPGVTLPRDGVEAGFDAQALVLRLRDDSGTF